MRFTKMQGCGNDYIYIDCTEAMLPDPAGAAVRLSDRHFGIGGDGMILICPSEKADVRMAMYNADGSEGSMCGNGVRCVGKFVYDKGLARRERVTVETRAGVKTLDLTVEDGKVSQVRVDMGAPCCDAAALPVVGLGDRVVGRQVHVAGQDWTMTCVNMGNPHAVVWVEDVNALNLERIGPQFERHPMFPNRVNTQFVHILNQRELELRVWERGSGETLACGTGACASAVAARLCGLCTDRVTAHLRGGDLTIELGRDGHVYLTGPAVTVFEGEIEAP